MHDCMMGGTHIVLDSYADVDVYCYSIVSRLIAFYQATARYIPGIRHKVAREPGPLLGSGSRGVRDSCRRHAIGRGRSEF